VAIKRQYGDSPGDKDSVFFDCTNVKVKIFSVILYYNFVRCYYWNNLDMGYITAIISYNYIQIYNYLKIRNSLKNKN
jgi:hypothetical protein